MYPYPGKVVAEALLHVLPQRWLQRSAVASDDLTYTGGNRIDLLILLSPTGGGAGAAALRRRRLQRYVRYPCYLFRDAVGLMFQWVIDGPDF